MRLDGAGPVTVSSDLASCIAEHTTKGPRYTSYPPATELGSIAVDRVQRELEAVSAAGETVSLYVHIPFCHSPCAYCGCNVIATRDAERGIGYVDQLATEMALAAGLLRNARVTEIALGGGSPDFLAPRALRMLIGATDRYFRVAPGAWRSIELDPRTTTTAQIEALADTGFQSLSMGVQDFDEDV
jgi:oxygen-independent coproporphyrinogen-3 oxidase